MTPPRTKKTIEVSPGDSASIESYVSSLHKTFGEGSGFLLSDEGRSQAVPTIPSNICGIDRALKCGGLPIGRIAEIYGPESSGKTTLALQFIASAQKMDQSRVAHFVDAEHALDPVYAEALGVDTSRFIVSQPDNGEQSLSMVEHAARSNFVSIVVVDSVAALVPQAELDGSMGDAQMGVQARLMSQAMRKLTGITHKSNVAVIFINQIRMKIGVMFGNPETTAGGQALKFYASMRLEVRKGTPIKNGEETIGQQMKLKVAKNKIAPPFGTCVVDLIYGKGFDAMASLLEEAVDRKIVEKSGAWYSYNSERLGQGAANASQFLSEHTEVAKKIEEAMMWRHP